MLAHAGALALLAGAVDPAASPSWPERWNVFAVLSPFEAIGAAVAAWVVAQALELGAALRRHRRRRADRVRRPDAGRLAGAAAVHAPPARRALDGAGRRRPARRGRDCSPPASAACTLLAQRSRPPRVDPGPLVLGLAGAVLAGRGDLHQLRRLQLAVERAGRGRERRVRVRAGGPGRGHARWASALLGAQPRLAAGLLLAAGTAASLHYLGVIVAAWRAIGEVGDIRAAGFIGVLGGPAHRRRRRLGPPVGTRDPALNHCQR